MARSFDQILAEVTAQSDPQRQTVLKQIADLPTQQAAQEQGLEAKKNQAYDDILGGARQRGLGFSGIPLSEQAKYNATDYAPALANLKSTYGQRQGSLESALAGIGTQNYATANDMFNQERSFEEQQRQFNETLAQQQRQAAAAAATPNPLAGLFGGSSTQTNDPYASIDKNGANVAIKQLLGTNNATTVANTIKAIQASAARGNVYDKYKLELLGSLGNNSQYGNLLTQANKLASQVKF